MRICDRHEEPKPQAVTLKVSEVESYDLCMTCYTEFQVWVGNRENKPKEEPVKRGRPRK